MRHRITTSRQQRLDTILGFARIGMFVLRSEEHTISLYPKTVREVLSRRVKFRSGVLKAVKRFKKSRPWTGTRNERAEKFQTLHADLCAIYELQTKLTLRVWRLRNWAHYSSDEDRIVMPQMSVLTYLHEFAHAAYGPSERKACRWSLNLFQRCFPKQFARCRQEGHVFRRS